VDEEADEEPEPLDEPEPEPLDEPEPEPELLDEPEPDVPPADFAGVELVAAPLSLPDDEELVSFAAAALSPDPSPEPDESDVPDPPVARLSVR
jgi:periplasmic protein TonB